jgi:hypothetical protein
MSQSTCQSLRDDLLALNSLKADFDVALNTAIATNTPEDLERIRDLKARLESGITALKEKLIPPELKEFHLKEQYDSQIAVLERTHILETLPSGEKGIKGIDGKEYPIPTYEQILARMKEKKEMLGTKKEQGFTKLLLVPFGMSLDILLERYKAAILRAHNETDPKKKLKAEKASPTDSDEFLDLDTAKPLYIWDGYTNADKNGSLVYHPKSFAKDNHGGNTKSTLLADPKSAWQIMLVEEGSIPAKDAKRQPKGGRTRLDAGATAESYLNVIGNGAYEHESGMTPEDWLMLAITRLEETGEVTDDWDGKGKASYNTGAWFPAAERVPSAYWLRGVRRANVAGCVPRNPYDNFGSRPPVRV